MILRMIVFQHRHHDGIQLQSCNEQNFPGSVDLGRLLFATAIAASGIQQLVTAAFVRLVPRISAPAVWAYLVGVILILAGVAIALGSRVRLAAAVLGALLVIDILFLHLPKALSDPTTGFLWTNPCKALAMLGGVLILAGALNPLGPMFLAAFLILGGIQHFVYADFVAKLVPAWIPDPKLWVYLTGTALIAGGVGLLVPKTARLAAIWVGIMIFCWVVLLHIPRALAAPHDHGESSAIFEALAFSGIAFMLAGRRE